MRKVSLLNWRVEEQQIVDLGITESWPDSENKSSLLLLHNVIIYLFKD